MIPVIQTVFGYPDGNCYAACIASILEVPLESCPVIPGDVDFHGTWEAWLNERGFAQLYFPIEEDAAWVLKGYSILSGISPRNLIDERGEPANHVVVALDGKMVHDPHPDRTYLQGRATSAVLIYRLDPKETR